MQCVLLVSNSPESTNKAGFIVFHPERNNLIPKFCPLTSFTWKCISHISDFGLIYVPPRTKRKFNVESGYVYVIGGYDNIRKKFLRSVLRYDLLRGEWFHCKKMNIRRACFTPFLYDGKIFCAGGYISKTKITDGVESYEPMMDMIEKEEHLPEPCGSYGCASYRKKVFLIGGKIQLKNDIMKTSSHFWSFEFDDKPVIGDCTNTEKVKRFINIERAKIPIENGIVGHKIVICEPNNRIYLIGGSNTTNESKSSIPGIHYAYIDTIMSSKEYENEIIWYKRNIPELMRSNSGTVLINNKIFAIGGSHYNTNSPTTIVEVDENEQLDQDMKHKSENDDNAEQIGVYFLKDKNKQSEMDLVQVNETIGYFDWRRKTYTSLYNLRSGDDINLENIHCVVVDMNDRYAEFNKDRYNWLIQWSLW